MSTRRSIVLVSCVSRKRDGPIRAKELYDSPLFRAQRTYAERFGDRWFILSAKHYLLDPEMVIERYEQTLKGAGVAIQRNWSQRVFDQLVNCTEPTDEIIVTAGEDYCRYLVPLLERRGNLVLKPLKGLRQGERPPRLNQLASQGVKIL